MACPPSIYALAIFLLNISPLLCQRDSIVIEFTPQIDSKISNRPQIGSQRTFKAPPPL